MYGFREIHKTVNMDMQKSAFDLLPLVYMNIRQNCLYQEDTEVIRIKHHENLQ